jgi:hypothetical protein
MEKEKNIWENFDFSGKSDVSAYNLLAEQSKELIVATKGVLKMEVDAIDSIIEEGSMKIVALYILYVISPRLGNYRRKILTVIEGKEKSFGRFPVDIYCNIDNKTFSDISEPDFLKTVSEILGSHSVKESIESLFKQSNEYIVKSPSNEEIKSMFNKKNGK